MLRNDGQVHVRCSVGMCAASFLDVPRLELRLCLEIQKSMSVCMHSVSNKSKSCCCVSNDVVHLYVGRSDRAIGKTNYCFCILEEAPELLGTLWLSMCWVMLFVCACLVVCVCVVVRGVA